MITITFQFTDVAAAAALMSKLNGNEQAAITAGPLLGSNDKADMVKQAPGKPSAATTARSRPTVGEAQSPKDPSVDAPASVSAGTPPAVAAPSAPLPVAYPDLQKAVLTLHKMDPTAAVPIALGLGVATFKLLPEAKWAEALALVNAAIEARRTA